MIQIPGPDMRLVLIAFMSLFVLPLGGAAAWWTTVDRPANWRSADWSATGLLGDPALSAEPAIHVLAARTGGMKGAFSVHTWLVLKPAGATAYERYDKVGWGNPVRRNAYAADARWYSNPPFIVASVTGARAAVLMDEVRAAIETYPHDGRGAYRIWPGPNSNSFVAHVLREVPGLGAVLPPHAVGKDWLAGGRLFMVDSDWRDAHVSIFGLAGFSVGMRSGVEIHLLGQSLGVDFAKPALKLPGVGRIGLP